METFLHYVLVNFDDELFNIKYSEDNWKSVSLAISLVKRTIVDKNFLYICIMIFNKRHSQEKTIVLINAIKLN
jgi:hypothetical protein